MVGLVVQGVVLMSFAGNLWFVMDDWDFLLLRGTIPGESRGWLEPKNGHWSTLTIAIYRTLFSVFGLRTYLPYAAVTITFHLLIAVSSYLVLRRVKAGRAPALAGSWALLFMGVGGDAVMYSAAMNHLGSILLGWLALLLRRSGRPLLLVALPLVGAVMFSNTGITAVFFVVAFVAIDEGLRPAVKLTATPAVAYVLWYALYGHVEASTQMPATGWDYLKVPQLVWQGMSLAAGKAIGFEEAGPALLIAVVVGAFATKTDKQALRHLAWAGILAAVFMSTVLALSRQFGDPGTGRYGYYTLAFLVPAVALCVEGLARLALEPTWLPIAMSGALLTGYAVNGVLAEKTFYDSWLPITRPEEDRTLGMIAAVDAGERALTDFSGALFNGDINPQRISQPSIRRALPPGKATAQGRVDAEAQFMVLVSTSSAVAQAPGGLDQIAGSFDATVSGRQGCHTYRARGQRPALVLGTGQGNEISVTSQSTEIVTSLLRGQSTGSLQRTWPVQPGKVFISTTAKDAMLFITFNGSGDYEVCKS